MGFSKRRLGATGVRWIALYKDSRGRQRSAGTFERKRDADAAWQSAETVRRSGRAGDPAAAKLKFADYVDKQWFPNHVVEPTTREGYRYCLDAHIIPWFGPMRMRDVMPSDVREWITHLVGKGVSPARMGPMSKWERRQQALFAKIPWTASVYGWWYYSVLRREKPL